MATGDLQVGPLRLRANNAWSFHAFGNMVLARADSQVGNLQITLAFAAGAPADADHEACLQILRMFMDRQPASDEQTKQCVQPTALFGEVMFRDTKVLRCYWYRYKNGRLLLAIYQCDADKVGGCSEELSQAREIAASMEYV